MGLPAEGTSHLLIEGPQTAITVGLKSPKEDVGLVCICEATSSLHRPPQACLACSSNRSSPEPSQPSPIWCPEASKVHLLSSSDQKWRTESSSSLCLLPRWQKHEVTPGHSPQALTSNTHLVYCWNTETQDQSQWGKCSMPQFTDP